MYKIFKHYIPKTILLLGLVETLILFVSIGLALLIFREVYFSSEALTSGSEALTSGSEAQTFDSDAETSTAHMYFSVFIFICVMQIGMISMGLYGRDLRESQWMMTLRIAFSMVIGVSLLMLLDQLVELQYLGLNTQIFAFSSAFLGVMFSRLVLYQQTDNILKRKILILGVGEKAQQLHMLRRKTDKSGVEIVGYVNIGGSACHITEDYLLPVNDPLSKIIDDNYIEEIVVAVDDRRKFVPIDDLLVCKMKGVNVIDITSYLERQLGKIDLNTFQPSTLVFADGFTYSLKSASKRLMDILLSTVALFVTLPLMLFTALAILYESGGKGPVIYRQERVGLNGRLFTLYKFRSMKVDAEKDGMAVWASQNDDRVTKIGAFIRKTRIDELPQMINVLKGDLSVVGPRPEREQFVAELSEKLRFYKLRHFVKPGITGWAQIRYPYGSSIEDAREKLQYELYYIKNYSPFLDMVIIIQTIAVILWGKGAR